MECFGLRNKIAIVTGGNRGIGKAIALALGKAGADVVLAARNTKLLEKTVEEIRAEGGEAFGIECDLAREKDILSLVENVVHRYGKIDILVNNAGISPFVKRSEEVEKEEWEDVLRVNLTAPFLLCRQAGRVMIENGWGRIINIASIGGVIGLPRQIAYCVAKAGLIEMTKVLALEWTRKHQITVNAVAPGYVATDLTEGMRSSEVISKNLLGRIPAGRFGEAHEIVGAVLYFASEDAGYTTGAVLTVDGGWTAA